MVSIQIEDRYRPSSAPISGRYRLDISLLYGFPFHIYILEKGEALLQFHFIGFLIRRDGKTYIVFSFNTMISQVWNGKKLQLQHCYFSHSWAFEYDKCSIFFFMSKLQDAKGKFKRTTPIPMPVSNSYRLHKSGQFHFSYLKSYCWSVTLIIFRAVSM